MTVDERAMLLYAGCYHKVEDPQQFYAMCSGYCPTKSLFEKNGRELMDSLVEKGLVTPRLEYDDIPEEEWQDYNEDEFIYDWTPEGRKIAKKQFHLYWFFFGDLDVLHYYDKMREYDGNINRVMSFMSDEMTKGINGALPYRALDRLQIRHDEAFSRFDKFMACPHAPGYDEHDLFIDDVEKIEGPLEKGYYEQPTMNEVIVEIPRPAPAPKASPAPEQKKIKPWMIVVALAVAVVIGACVGVALANSNGPSASLDNANMLSFEKYVDDKHPEGYYRAVFDITLSGADATLYIIHKDGSVLGSIPGKVGKNSYAVYLHHPNYITMKAEDITNIRL